MLFSTVSIRWHRLGRTFKHDWSIHQHLCLAFAIRVALIVYGGLHDRLFELKYTDIDYHVFTDGSRYLDNGQSPFLRDGYRYTPLFAWLTYPNLYIGSHFAKYMFAAFDVLTAWFVYLILTGKQAQQTPVTARQAAALWLYNPLPLIVCTRGSNDSFVTLLVLATLHQLLNHRSIRAGLLFGLAVHCKLYPIIYAPLFYLFLSGPSVTHVLHYKAILPLNRHKAAFTFTSIGSFALVTYLCYVHYGQLYVDEAWLHHLTRRDLAHNFSPYFYLYQWSNDATYQRLLGYIAFVPQLVSIVFLAISNVIVVNRTRPANRLSHLFFALFMSTFLFVTFNKVCTSQYFLWYLSLLPLMAPYLQISVRSAAAMLGVWLLSQGNCVFLPINELNSVNRKLNRIFFLNFQDYG
jgi:phosphatidylinositol glycan class M